MTLLQPTLVVTAGLGIAFRDFSGNPNLPGLVHKYEAGHEVNKNGPGPWEHATKE